MWSCQWLVDPGAASLRRPDRSRYVIDIMPDFIGMQNNETGEIFDRQVMQVWCDPDYPEARHDPALRRYMEHVAATRGQATMIRWNSADAVVIFPPCLSEDGQWHEEAASLAGPDSAWRNPMQAIHEEAARMRQARGAGATTGDGPGDA